MLAEEFDVRRIRLDEGVVPGDIDVCDGKMGQTTDKIQFAIDQYLMRGGAVIVLAGMYGVKPHMVRSMLSEKTIRCSICLRHMVSKWSRHS